VIGHIPDGFEPTTQKVEYAAGAMMLDADNPSRVIARSDTSILAPHAADERNGVVPNVVFPTAIESIDGVRYVFYGLADAKIGVARLDPTHPSTSL
jgi:beta-1,2-mannobiose phosphorylase / 1,2-beta-oligomannan phosphorylase